MTPPGNGWERVFFDDFDTLDTTRWYARDNYPSDGLGTFRASQVAAAEGILTLSCAANYDSARVSSAPIASTVGSGYVFSFGWVETRIRFSPGAGAWHGFWLWGWGENGAHGPQELDVEPRGNYPTTLSLGHIWQIAPSKLSDRVDAVFAPFDNQFHTYAYHWQPGQVDIYIDGVLFYTHTVSIPAVPMQILFDCKVGGSFAGDPDGTTPYPLTVEVDWVGVWQKTDWRGYVRLTYAGVLTAGQQADFAAVLVQVCQTRGLYPKHRSHIRQLATSDYLVEYSAPAALGKADWVDVLAPRLGIDATTVDANLTVTTYAGADWNARRLTCMAALGI